MRKVMRAIFRHILQLAILSLALMGFTAHSARAQAGSAITPREQRVIDFMRERKHAYERTDAPAWGRHVSEQCLFIQAGGRVYSKALFMAGMVPFVGYKFSAVVHDVQAAEFGDTILLTYREKEMRDYGVQRTENAYIDTETYTRLNGQWQLVSWTENAVPAEHQSSNWTLKLTIGMWVLTKSIPRRRSR